MFHVFRRVAVSLALIAAFVAAPLVAAADVTAQAPNDTIAFIRIQSLNALFEGWGRYANSVGGMMAQLPLQAQVGQLLSNPMLTGIALDKPLGIAVVVGAPDEDGDLPEPVRLIYLPLSDADVFGEAMQAGRPDFEFKVDNNYAVLTDNRRDLNLARPAGKALPVPDAVIGAWVDVKTLSPKLAPQLAQMQQGMRMMAQFQPDAAQQLNAMADLLTAIDTNMKQTESIALSATIDAQNLRIETTVSASPGSEFSRMLAAGKPLDARLLQYLPRESFAVMAGAVSGELFTMMNRFQTMQMAALAGPDQRAEITERLERLSQDIARAIGPDGIQMVGGFTATGPGAGMEMVAVSRMANPDAYRNAVVEMMDLVKPLQGQMQQPGVEMSMDYRKDAHRIEGVAVDRFEMSVKIEPQPGMPMDPSQMMRMMLGGDKFVQLIAYFDGYSVVATGPKAENLLSETIVSVRQNQARLTTTPMHVATMRQLPDNALMLGYLDPKGLARWIGGLGIAPPPIVEALNRMPLGRGAISLAATSKEGAGTAVINLPATATSDVMDIVNTIQQAFMQMMMEGMGGQPAPM